MKTLVLGIGNKLLTDDGIGIHVLQALNAEINTADDIELIDGGTLSFPLIELIENATQLIVIDAAQLQIDSGAMKIFKGTSMDQFLNAQRKFSVHEINLIEMIKILQIIGNLPKQRALIAIQPEKIEWGELPTPKLAAVIPSVCQQIKTIINDWRNAE